MDLQNRTRECSGVSGLGSRSGQEIVKSGIGHLESVDFQILDDRPVLRSNAEAARMQSVATAEGG